MALSPGSLALPSDLGDLLFIRILSGCILALAVIGLLEFFPAPLIQAVVMLLCGLGAFELLRLKSSQKNRQDVLVGVSLTVFVFAGIVFLPDRRLVLGGLSLALVLALFYFMVDQDELSHKIDRLTFCVFVVFFCGILFGFWGLILNDEPWRFWLYLMLGATSAGDVFAYFTGRALGRHPMAPMISPGKTWEGYVGGLVGGVVAAFICWAIFDSALDVQVVLFLGVLLPAVGPLGDLSESFLKRAFGVKDMGHWIPGHGGLLDRVDALLFTAPIVYYFKIFLG